MESIAKERPDSPDVLNSMELGKPDLKDNETSEVFTELERGVYAALETYSNVHRGSGHNSIVTTHLYEQARKIVLEYLGLNKGKYVVIFCSPRRAEKLKAQLKPESYHSVSSREIGLSLGVRALAVNKKSLSKGIPFQTGGGTARLISTSRVIWDHVPDKFEAGTPAIINIIAFAKALQLIRHFGKHAFHVTTSEKLAVNDLLYHDELEDYSGRELLNELRKTLIGRNVLVPTLEGVKPFINLDNGASTPTFTPIWDTFRKTWRQTNYVQKEIIPEVRSICANFLSAPLSDFDVIFTSNTTEAINLTAESLSNEPEMGFETVVLNTILEHNSNELPWRVGPGFSLIRLPVDDEGFIDLNELETHLCEYNQKDLHGKKRIRLVAVSGASNVLGTFNDLAEISRIVHQYGAQLLVDAAQLVAHRKVEIEKCGIDYLAFSAHKVYAPFGCGVLVVRKGLLNFSPSELESIQSSGEENVGGIAALGKALVLLQRIGLDLIQQEEQALTWRTLHGLEQISGITIYGIKNRNSPRFAQKGGVIVFGFKNIMPNRVAKELAMRGGIGIRYGCHCTHLLIKRLLKISPFLEHLQNLIVTLFPKVSLPGLARVSLGIENSEEDVGTFIHVLDKIAQHSKLAGNDFKQQMDDFVKAAARKVYNQLK
jgi:selenocysteine lyase/cysteine desulfurase